MKIGVRFSIDVTKIDKNRIIVGEKGKYVELTTFLDLSKDKKAGLINQECSKEDRENKVRMPIIGDCTIFWRSKEEADLTVEEPKAPDVIDDIPF